MNTPRKVPYLLLGIILVIGIIGNMVLINGITEVNDKISDISDNNTKKRTHISRLEDEIISTDTLRSTYQDSYDKVSSDLDKSSKEEKSLKTTIDSMESELEKLVGTNG